ncbi:nucleotidyltransferase family protein [Synechococcus elongatus]|uniref:nucleotidyltransferase family protein n=1 Tax=Synechococcus elongatus TaxID=32046 RepID=UPI000F7DE24E|nr:nucleotidyltransferase domain-containing protein [Synechococcus elongatus]
MNPLQASLNHVEVLNQLRDFLAQRGSVYGLKALGCFGSVARSEATTESDVDIIYQLNDSACMTLFDLALLQQELIELLGVSVDLIEFREATPKRLRDRIEKEAVYA